MQTVFTVLTIWNSIQSTRLLHLKMNIFLKFCKVKYLTLSTNITFVMQLISKHINLNKRIKYKNRNP